MNGQNDKIYTAADIIRYHSGKMPEAEMHALEKAALEDPFLADALEGYVNTATPNEDLSQIRERLSEKGGKIIPIKRSYTWIRIAALVVVILGIGYMSYYFNSPKQNVIVAKNDTSRVEKKMDEAKANTEQETVVNKPPITADREEYKTTRSLNKHKEKSINQPNRYFTQADSVSTIGNTDKSAEVKEDQNEVTSAPSQKQNVLNGKVVDTKGKPVPNASITDNNNIVTRTDNSGQFNFKANDSTAQLNIAATGYETKNTKLNNGQTVILEPKGKQLNEVVVTALGIRREKKSLGYSTTKTQPTADSVSEPLIGWQKFNKYITDNINVPAKEKEEKGEVILSFETNKKGSPVKINVEKSLNTDSDKKAIKLLRDGPKWKYVKEKRCKVSVQF